LLGRWVATAGRPVDRFPADLGKRLEAMEVFEDLVGQSPQMREVFRLIDAVSATPATVHIRGESGSAAPCPRG
jgi:DNA-binding NtrC family response regulator